MKISIHAPREGSDVLPPLAENTCGCISIHAPREGSDEVMAGLWGNDEISIHAPREGSDLELEVYVDIISDFYPRSPRGERRCVSSV